MSTGSGTRPAMTAGVRKIPPPMVEPTSTATALHSPRRRGRRSPQRSVGGGSGGVDDGVDMRGPNIHFRTHDATLRAARLARGHLHLPPHHPRRHRPHHRLGARVRRALAALQRPAAAAPRPADRDRVRAPPRRGCRERPGDGTRGVRAVAAAPPSTALHRPPPPWAGGVRRARTPEDRKSTRLNSSHPSISYAVFCLKKKKLAHCSPSRYNRKNMPIP